MALVLADRVRDTTTTTGTGTVTLSGTAPTGYQNFSVIGNANTTYYTINSDTQWEVGVGTYTSSGTTLARNTVLASSNGGALVDFAAGTKDVFVTYPSEKAVTEDYGNALAATTAANLAGGAAGSIPYQTAANTTAMLATGTGVLIGGTTPSYTMSPSLTQVTVAGDPSTALQVATKQYVDTQTSAGIHYHEPVRVESPLNLNATYNNGTAGVGATLTNAGTQAALVIDGVTVIVADRVLIYQQTNPVQNGIYVVTNVGSGSTNWVLTRSSDADTYVNASPDGLSEGSTVFVQQGTTGAGTTYTCNTTGTITFGTTAITFVEISSAQIYSAGTGLTLTGTTFSLTAPVATSLGGTGLTTFTSGGAVYATSASVLTTGTLPATAGGTGQSSYTAGDLVYATSATTLGVIADVATGNALISGGAGADPSYGKIGLTTHISGTLAVGNGGTGATTLTGYLVGNGTSAFTATATIPTSALSGTISLTTQVSGTLGAGNGGTGLSSYTVGDILYASGTTALSSLADVATGNALISGGVSNAPLWGKIGLTTHVSGTLPVANGGSGATTLTGYLKGNGTSAFTASATIPAGDITGAALTEFDDTNVTMTLGGSPSTALLAATSMTLGWTGQLAVSRGGTGNSTLTSNYLLKGNGVSPVAASVVYDDGTNVGIGTASPLAKLDVVGQGVFQGSTQTAYRGANIGALNINNNSADGTVDFTQGLVFTDNTNNSGAWAHAGIVATGSAGFRGNLVFGTDNDGTQANAITERMRITSAGDLGLNTTTPVGRLSVVSGSSTGAATSAWSGNYSVFGPNAGGATGAAIALGYNTSADAAEILALAPAVAWKPLNLYSAGLNLYASSGAIGASLNGSGTFSAATDVRAPVFYDSADTAFYVDPASGSRLGGNVTFDGGSYVAANGDFIARRSSGSTGVYYFVTTGTAYLYYDGSSYIFGSSGPVTTSTSFRAPIFYDSDNTAYYLDPASGSNLNGTLVNNGGTAMTAGWNRNMMLASTFPVLVFNSANTKYAGIGVDYTTAAAAMRFWVNASSSDVVTGTNAMNINSGGYVEAGGSFRAPIFYDLDNTAYYVDPASTSVFSTVRAATIQHSSGSTAIVLNSGTWTQFCDPNGGTKLWLGGTADPNNYYNANIHYFRNTGSGTTMTIDSAGTVIATADMRAPIFYDSNNTGYYVDPASTSVLNGLTVGGYGVVRTAGTINGNIDTDYGETYVTFDPVPAGTPPISSPNIRTINVGNNFSRRTQLAYTYDTDRAWFRRRNDGGWGGWYEFAVFGNPASAGALYGTIYYDGNNTAYYVDPAGTSVINTTTNFNIVTGTTECGIRFRIAGAGGDFVGRYSNYVSLYNSTSTGEIRILDTGYMSFSIYGENAASWRAPIFYDSNNTNYYVDAAGTSVLNSVAGYSLRNIEDVSIDTPYGIYFSSNLSTAYAIFREAGAWSHPYPDLRIAFHTGIKMGAASGYGGMKFYTDYDMVTQVMSINGTDGLGAANVFVNNSLQAASSLRAPIFYDSNDTAFYVDPASTSYLNTVSLGAQTWRSDITWNSAVNINVPASAECSFDVATSGTWQVWDLTSSAPFIKCTAGTNVEIGQAGSRGLYVYGSITASGNVTAYSDVRVKANIETIPSALDKLNQIRGVTYTRTDLEDKERRYGGVIAQEIEAVLPEAVFETHDHKSVDYNATIGLLIQAVKELTNKVKALEAKEQ